VGYFEAIDGRLCQRAKLVVYGGAAFILLDQPGRTSVDVDIAGPYSQADFGDLRRAAEGAGLPVNPTQDVAGDHLEWVGPLRLCLSRPEPEDEVNLWQGSLLTVVTVSPARLIASKLIRYDEVDRGDVQFLVTQTGIGFGEIANAVNLLPSPFREDSLVRDNLGNLKVDLSLWREERS
jgi:hypothetical protein